MKYQSICRPTPLEELVISLWILYSFFSLIFPADDLNFDLFFPALLPLFFYFFFLHIHSRLPHISFVSERAFLQTQFLSFFHHIPSMFTLPFFRPNILACIFHYFFGKNLFYFLRFSENYRTHARSVSFSTIHFYFPDSHLKDFYSERRLPFQLPIREWNQDLFFSLKVHPSQYF